LIAEILRGLQVLLVIDNVEHVITAAPFIAEILAVSDSVTVLATSRERLGLAAEHVVDVDPLRVDDPDGAHQSPCPSARR